MRMATCHPDRPYFAKGLCKQCYHYEYNRRPEVIARQRALDQERYRNNAEQGREYSRRYRCEHRDDPERIERIRQYNKRYHLEHKDDPEYIEKMRQRSEKYYKENMTKELTRKKHLKYCYNITPEDYATMLNEQGGRCAICGKPVQENSRHFCVDHDHETGVICGLLCLACNTMLGNAKDDPEILKIGALYLERFIDE